MRVRRPTAAEDPARAPVLLPALARVPGHLVWRAAARVQAAQGRVLPPGVDLHAYAVLLALGGDATRSQQELADTVRVSRTTMVRVAADLTAQGLVQRARKAGDRRSYALTRTAEGAAAARRWRRHAENLEAALTAGFTVQERGELRRLLLVVAEPDLALTPGPLRESVAFLVTRVHFRMHRDLVALLAPLGIEPPHFGVLAALRASGPVPQTAVARYLGLSGARVVQLVDLLEHQGLVERRRLTSDRRPQVLHLLPAAGGLLERADVLAEEAAAARLGPLSADERTRLVDLLARFVSAPAP